MKKILCGLMIAIIFIAGCANKPKESEMDFFNKNPLQYELLNKDEFDSLLKNSGYIKNMTLKEGESDYDIDYITYESLIRVIGKPQREGEFSLNPSSGSINPRIILLKWDLSDDKVVRYIVILSDDFDENEISLNSFLKYGIVLDPLTPDKFE